MSMQDLVGKLNSQSREKVVVRGRQYLRSNCGSDVLATEIQAVYVAESLSNVDQTPGLIWLSYHDPRPDVRYPDLENPMKLRSVIWTGEEFIGEAWRCLCDSWVGVPSWLSTKPVIFCRQFHKGDEYTNIEPPDLFFARKVDEVLSLLRQHFDWLERRLRTTADKTPVKERGAWYRTLHRDTTTRRGLIIGIEHRLGKFCDGQFNALAKRLGLVQIEPKKH